MAAAGHDTLDVTSGAHLRLIREQKKLSIQEVSEKTHISRSNLNAIEEENYDQLPADTFIRGLVTIYGNFLGINGAETAKLFLQERDQQQPRGKKNRPGKSGRSLTPKKLAEPAHISSATIAGILLVLIVVSLTSFCLYTGWNPFSYFLEQIQEPPVVPLTETIVLEPVPDESVITPETPENPADLTTNQVEDSNSTAETETSSQDLPAVIQKTPDTQPDN